jgi:hypothetical protein
MIPMANHEVVITAMQQALASAAEAAGLERLWAFDYMWDAAYELVAHERSDEEIRTTVKDIVMNCPTRFSEAKYRPLIDDCVAAVIVCRTACQKAEAE